MDTDILEKWERKSYLLHMMDPDILLKVKRDISSPHNGYRYFRKMGKKAISSPHDGY